VVLSITVDGGEEGRIGGSGGERRRRRGWR